MANKEIPVEINSDEQQALRDLVEPTVTRYGQLLAKLQVMPEDVAAQMNHQYQNLTSLNQAQKILDRLRAAIEVFGKLTQSPDETVDNQSEE